MTFRALVVEKDEDGATRAGVKQVSLADLPEGEVTVAVEYSTLNYKDGLCLGSGGGLVKAWPHVPGIDFAGTVEASSDARFAKDDRVVLTGWRVGETRWGGYAEMARVKADWLVALPEGLTTRQAMAVGTAGLTAMLAIQALVDHGLAPGAGPVLVTGASGGVGSVAVALLAAMGHEVVAVSGRDGAEGYLKGLGAARIVPRADLAEVIRRPLETESWAGAVDAVGGQMLARLLGQMRYGAAVATVGLAGGSDLPASVIPFILRGVALLGIDSVLCPTPRRLKAWAEIAARLDKAALEAMIRPARLEELPELGAQILQGGVRGRVVVDPRG